MKVVYVSNAFDPLTREQNKISSDSPAAFVKVFNVLNGLKKNNIDVLLLSINIANRLSIFYGSKEYNNIRINYLKNVKYKLLRNLRVLFFLPLELYKQKADTYIFYNYAFEYIFAFFFLFISKKKCILDIEDDVNDELPLMRKIIRKILVKVYIFFCHGKVLTVNKAIVSNHKHILKAFICYGAGVFNKKENRQPKKLFCSGSLLKETGMEVIVDLYKDKSSREFLETNFEFNICGFGPYEVELKQIKAKGFKFWGRVNNETYTKLLENSDIAFVLKSPESSMGQTTFPSKVVEYALNDLALICTPVSDIPDLFSEKEIYFVNNSVDIINVLKKILNSSENFFNKKLLQSEIAQNMFEDKLVGKRLKDFLLSR